MADIHVLTGDPRGGWAVAFHFSVPDAVNAVGVNYRTALVNSGHGGSSIMAEGTGPGQITAAELGLVAAGELYEHTTRFRAEGNGEAPAAVRDNLRAKYTRDKGLVVDRLQAQLKYFGHTESEA